MDDYGFKREISGVNERWHNMEIPQDVLAKMRNDLSDIRIYGITSGADTLEVPYLMHVLETKEIEEKVGFGMLNFSKNDSGYFYTFQVDNEELINQIALNFYRSNFDWRITLEGSQNQNEWLTILDDYRILDIHNDDTQFNFTKLNFPDSRYTFYRLFVNSKTDPKFESASISSKQAVPGKVNSYPVTVIDKTDKYDAANVYNLSLSETARISSIFISVQSDFDYYRPITISRITDSVETETGVKYMYEKLTTGTLNSIEPNTFSFPAVTTSQLKIAIENGDNKPLEIGEFRASGFVHELIGRFTDKADYYLVYGNLNARKSQYDIERFRDNIPLTLSTVSLDSETIIPKSSAETSLPLFESKRWLWGVLIIVIIVLGWFSLKMMRS